MKTKYVIIIPDGAADEPIEELGGKTVIEAAEIPNIDSIVMDGKQGVVRTIPPRNDCRKRCRTDVPPRI